MVTGKLDVDISTWLFKILSVAQDALSVFGFCFFNVPWKVKCSVLLFGLLDLSKTKGCFKD